MHRPSQDGCQERHERIGRADRAERVRAKKPADDERVRYIIKLLQQVPQIMGNAKRSSVLGMEPVVRSICAKITVSFSYSGEFRFIIADIRLFCKLHCK